MTDAELDNAGPFAAHHCAESQHYKDEADKLRSLLGELDRSNERLTDALESARRERDEAVCSRNHWLEEFKLRVSINMELIEQRDQAEAERDTARAEAEQLRSALLRANEGFEKHERLWYLAQDEAEQLRAERDAYAIREDLGIVQLETAEAIAAWLDETFGPYRSTSGTDRDDHNRLLAAIRHHAWRTTKGDAGK